jgi:hypothetical protein
MFLDETRNKVLISLVSLIFICMTSTIVNYYSNMLERDKETSKFGYTSAIMFLIASVLSIVGVILYQVTRTSDE